jgi:hypothetical protein
VDSACILRAAPACADEEVPVQLTRRLDRAFDLLADLRNASVKLTRRRYQRVGRLLEQAAKRAGRYAAQKKPRLTMECADELRAAIEAVKADVAAECVTLGLCRPG